MFHSSPMDRRGAVFAAVALTVCLMPACAAPVAASGVAALDAGPVAARELALQDALSQAALSQGAHLQSAESLHEGVYRETGNVTAVPLSSGKVTVLNEGSDGELYHVKVKVDAAEQPLAMDGAGSVRATASVCQNAAGRQLRRRLVTTYFVVAQPNEADDLADLPTRLPQELAQRLARHPLFNVVNAGGVSVLPNERSADAAAGAASVRVLGRQQDAQFIVAGRVVSTAVTARFLRPTLFESSNTSQQGAYYTGPFSGLLGGAIKYVPRAREFDVEVWVYDALTGSIMASERLATVARGSVAMPFPLPFASTAFWITDYGKAIDRVLDEAVSRVASTLACVPFSARVVEVEAGERIYINAGGLDGLQVGDQLLLYKVQSPSGLRSVSSDPQLGVPETLVGDITIVQVQPRISMAVVRGGSRDVQQGDIVRYLPK